jgi:hypothetical protein
MGAHVLPDGLGEPNAELLVDTVIGLEHRGWESTEAFHLSDGRAPKSRCVRRSEPAERTDNSSRARSSQDKPVPRSADFQPAPLPFTD